MTKTRNPKGLAGFLLSNKNLKTLKLEVLGGITLVSENTDNTPFDDMTG
ncbi:hypothetical protein MGMO_11c00480 [Methyloglobulus morosus KoM1]|uniref:Uncharacterized protein n=1 Tax=Methyloglobulus morosus KoM1 TaxID=1116472 RepID=V5E2G3_9GAMM|nr:hypothetical protein [Methyloglobulus morosus]ESS73741.1 hypothetical protein MGMO_11c00480 [Methyloglobulus morosus KoM1]